MIERPIIFDGSDGHDDAAYFRHINTHRYDFVANIPNPQSDWRSFSVFMHRACCPTLSEDRLEHGKRATENTQWKVCSPFQEVLRDFVSDHYTQRPLVYCQSTESAEACGCFWDNDGQRR